MNKYALFLLVINVPHTKMGQETVCLATLTPHHSTRIPKLLPNQSKRKCNYKYSSPDRFT